MKLRIVTANCRTITNNVRGLKSWQVILGWLFCKFKKKSLLKICHDAAFVILQRVIM